MKKVLSVLIIIGFLGVAGFVFGEEPPAEQAARVAPSKIDPGDTAWVLASAALVMLMTPGLALFYGGMVRRKNVLGTIMQSFVAIALVSIQWILFGYSLSFGPDVKGIIGSLDWIGLQGVGLDPNPDYASSVPHIAFMIFQAMFAVITPALITGAFAERMKFSAYFLFILLWSTIVYDPIAHWVWGNGGWLKTMGVLDFAGGLVVHLSSGISALAAAIIIGKRKGYMQEAIAPHNLPMTVLGAGLLWFGWFGFNAGSALSSGTLSSMAFVATHTSAVAAILIWVIIEWLHRGKPTMFGAATGSVAGLATITPASGFVGPVPALIIGLAAGSVCYLALNMKNWFGYDDSLDAFGIHGIGGMAGVLCTGLFAQKLINPAGADGVFFGNPSLLGAQAIAVLAIGIYAFVATSIILIILKAIMGLRVSGEDEVTGLDLSLHGESGYSIGVGVGSTPAIRERRVAVAPVAKVVTEKPLTQRIPPKTTHIVKPSLYTHGVARKEMVSPPPEVRREKVEVVPETGERPFTIEVDGIDEGWFASWWRDMCSMDWGRAPQAFRDIYGYVSRFRDNTLMFKKGNPAEFKKRIEELLVSSGLQNFKVRIIR